MADEEVRKILLDALEKMPGVIRDALAKPKLSATNRLQWTGLALRLTNDPVGRQATDLDRKNAIETRQILKDAAPSLEKIRKEHSSERIRRKADNYLRIISRF